MVQFTQVKHKIDRKKRRKLHDSLLLSTTFLFMGIALFFVVINIVPELKIEGFATSRRFEMADITAELTSLAIALLFFFRDSKNGWSFLVAGLCIPLTGVLHWQLRTVRVLRAKLHGIATPTRPLRLAPCLTPALGSLPAWQVFCDRDDFPPLS